MLNRCAVVRAHACPPFLRAITPQALFAGRCCRSGRCPPPPPPCRAHLQHNPFLRYPLTGDESDQVRQSPAKVRKTGIVDPIEANWLPHRYTRLDNTAPQKLKELLSSLDGIVLSPFNLNAVTRVGSKEAKVMMLCELLEFVCGFDRMMPLLGDYRHQPTLVAALSAQMRDLGDRVRSLKLPPD